MQSIRSKILGAIIPLFIIALLGTSWGSYSITSSLLEKNFQTISIELENRVVTSLDTWMEARKSDVRLYSTNSELITALKTGNIDAQRSYIARQKDNWQRTMLGFFVADAKGNAWTTLNNKIVSIADRAYFPKVMAGETVISDPLVARGDGTTQIVLIVQPILDENKHVIGSIGGTVLLKDMFSLVGNSPLGENSMYYMLTADGTVITHPKKEYILKRNVTRDEQNADLKKILTEQALKQEKGNAKYIDENGTHFVFFQRVKGSNWVFVSEVSEKAVTEITGQALHWTMLISLVALAAAIIITLVLVFRVTRPIAGLRQSVLSIAGNDLTKEVPVLSKDELGELSVQVNHMRESLRTMIHEITRTSDNVTMASRELHERSAESEAGLKDIGTAIEEIAVGSNEIAALISNVTQYMGRVAQNVHSLVDDSKVMNESASKSASSAHNGRLLGERAVERMDTLQQTMKESTDVIVQLGEDAQRIEEMVVLIREITEQTNLLALNAAIEAARAGENGRGFSVVADEVRKLADQSNAAATRIADIVGETRQQIGKAIEVITVGNTIVDDSGKMMKHVNDSFSEIAHDVEHISTRSHNIMHSVGQLNEQNARMTKDLQHATSITEESAAASEEMSQIAGQQVNVAQGLVQMADDLALLSEQLLALAGKFKM
ncbi:methyl-accepting chemotaxis protein [Aneurinibacillus uraniidurans]|uniref:methyl-accepting chemotaxis protein n=1 Tax=Aneurinibacillus uraniidurans TaxID=2966586 RepID=UPI00234A72FF|nr:methyl-accepting chemotaxis protein [Aneurinibacillus sp. B1]WCN36312.1 methyl-accepting chemotaxis protein [Aneurinibacillus sp. B1]